MESLDRIATYSFLSIALQDPFLDACVPPLPTGDGPWNEARGLWEGLSREHRSRLFRDAFGHTAAGLYPPYETHYGQPTVFEQTDVLADIAGFYRSFGLKVDATRGETPDHAGVEIEFAAYLAGMERTAPDAEKAAIAHDIFVAFLRDHIGKWGSAFGRLLARNAPSEEYRAVGRLLDAFLGAELVAAGLPPVDAERLPHPVPPQPIEAVTMPCGDAD